MGYQEGKVSHELTRKVFQECYTDINLEECQREDSQTATVSCQAVEYWLDWKAIPMP